MEFLLDVEPENLIGGFVNVGSIQYAQQNGRVPRRIVPIGVVGGAVGLMIKQVRLPAVLRVMEAEPILVVGIFTKIVNGRRGLIRVMIAPFIVVPGVVRLEFPSVVEFIGKGKDLLVAALEIEIFGTVPIGGDAGQAHMRARPHFLVGRPNAKFAFL